jgi:hypothetical protein
MASHDIPGGHDAFTKYMEFCYPKVRTNLAAYGIAPDKFVPLTADYTPFIAAEAAVANPDTATSTARHERDRLQKRLETTWRDFRNESLRYNPLVSDSDNEDFGIKVSGGVRHHIGAPTAEGGTIVIVRRGTCELEVQVRDRTSSKLKNPENAAGSNLYVAVAPVGALPPDASAYYKATFASDNTHDLLLPAADIGHRASIDARYANAPGAEGPAGPVETVVVS